MDVLTATEIDRRAWAVEQAVVMLRGRVPSISDEDLPIPMGIGAMPINPASLVIDLAGSLLAYIQVPVAAVNSKLLDAARGYDGTQNAAALIGALADALEAR